MPVWLIVAGLDLRRRLRDRSVLITAFIAPAALAVVMGLAFGPSRSTLIHIGIADEDGTARSTALVSAGLAAAALPPEVSVMRVGSGATLRQMVASGRLGAGIIVPAGFGRASENVAATNVAVAARLAVIAPQPGQKSATNQPVTPGAVVPVFTKDGTQSDQIAAELASAIDGRVAAGLLVVAATARTSDEALAVRAAEVPSPVVPRDGTLGPRRGLIGYFGPSMAIIFLFLGAGAGARSLVAERDTGTLARMGVAPVRPAAVIVGKVAAVGAVALSSLLAVWGVTVVAFSATWGGTAAVFALCVSTVIAFSGLAFFITTAARSPGQAEAATVVVGFGLALFGGNFFPPGGLPPLFEKLTLLTPNGWALEGFGSLAIDGARFGAIIPALGVLLLIGTVLGGIAVARLPKALAA